MKKIFIHAGPGKTGTSTIQHWLSRNVDLLAENGIHYPYHDVDSNGVSPGNYDAVLSQDENDKWELDADKTNSLLQRFNASECHTLLLSSEIFMGQIENLLSLMPNAKIILYFRNPLEVMESNYNQLVKRHKHTKKIAPNKKNLLLAINRFTELKEKFNGNTIIIKPYLYGIDENFSILNDFLKIIDPSLLVDGLNIVINRSYSFQALEFKRRINLLQIEKIDQILDVELQEISHSSSNYSLIEEYLYTELSIFLERKLNNFIDLYHLSELKIISEHIKKKNNGDYMCTWGKQEFSYIWKSLNENNPNLIAELCRIIGLRKEKALDLGLAYDFFMRNTATEE